jgi:hypothetical protein
LIGDGEAFFESLRQREDELLKNRSCEINAGQGFILRLAQPRTSPTSGNLSLRTILSPPGALIPAGE